MGKKLTYCSRKECVRYECETHAYNIPAQKKQNKVPRKHFICPRYTTDKLAHLGESN